MFTDLGELFGYDIQKMALFSIHILPCLDASCEDSLAISAAQREKKLLNGMIQNLLPAVGSSVRSIVLAYSSTVSSKMVWTRNIHDHMPRTSIKQSLLIQIFHYSN